MSDLPPPLDNTDRALIRLLRRQPRTSVVELSRRVGVARNTVQLRLKRMTERNILTGFGPDIERRAAGYQVLAFVTLTIAQGAHELTVDALAEIDEVLEIHTITGQGDLLLKVIAATNDHLHKIVQDIAAIAEVERTETQLALDTPIYRTVADLIANTIPEEER
ncbi:MAG: Lrp/AsnC family transcriptional regulator [Acidimicrobiales bacterium]